MPTVNAAQLQKLQYIRNIPGMAEYADPDLVAALDARIISDREALRAANQPAAVPQLDRPMQMDEISSPTAKAWNLFPTTTGMFKNAPNIPVAPAALLTVPMDIARGVAIGGKTIFEQGMNPNTMRPMDRYRKNLQSRTSLGGEAAQGLTNRIAQEDPNVDPNKLAAIYAGASNLVDVGGAVGTGLVQGVKGLVKGGANIASRVWPKAGKVLNAQHAWPKMSDAYRTQTPPTDVLQRIQQAPMEPPPVVAQAQPQPVVPEVNPFENVQNVGAEGAYPATPLKDPYRPKPPGIAWGAEAGRFQRTATPPEYNANIAPDAQGQLGFQDILQQADQGAPRAPQMAQFQDPNDPQMLRYLSQYFPVKHVLELTPSERLKLGNASAQELRDLAATVRFPDSAEQMRMSFMDPPREAGPYRPPVTGAGGQMELNFGTSMKGKLSPGFDFPETVPPPAPGRQRVLDSLKRRAVKGEQMEFDFTAGADDIIPGNAPGKTGNRAIMDQAIADLTAGRITEQEFAAIAKNGLRVQEPPQTYGDDLFPGQGYKQAPAQPNMIEEAAGAVRDQGQMSLADYEAQSLFEQGTKRAPAMMKATKNWGEDAAMPGMQEKLAAQPTPTIPYSAWDADTLALFESVDGSALNPIQKSAANSAIFEADDLLHSGDTAGAVARLKALRDAKMLDNREFDMVHDIIQRFEGKPIAVPKGDVELARGFKAVSPDKVIKGAKDYETRAERLKRTADAKDGPTAKDLDLRKMLSDINDMLGGNEGTSKQSKEAMRAAQIARAAWKNEHMPALLDLMKTSGMSAVDAVKSRYPNISPEDTKVLADFIMVGNSRVNKMDPQVAKVLMDNPLAKREVVSDASVRKAVKGAGAGKAADFLVNADIADVAAAKGHRYNLARLEAELMRADPTNAARHKEQVLSYLDDVQKLEQLPGVVLRHGGKFYEDAGFLQQLQADLKAGVYSEAEASIIQNTIDKANKLRPSLLKTLNDGITEYGINMMLYNTDTAMRNTLGGGIGVLTSPIERTMSAAATSVGRMFGKKDMEIKNPTEWQEIIPAVKAGVKAVPDAVKSGVKFFRHESPEGLARSYARKALAVRRDYKAGRITKEQFKAQRAELVRKNKAIGASFMPLEDQSSLGISNKRVLTSKNPALDLVGRVINFGTGAVKSMDVTQSYILLEMEKAAMIARKEAQALRKGKPPDYKPTTQDLTRMYDAVRMHTMRQKLPAGAQTLTRVVGSNAVTALTLPFMRAMIALPRYAMQRSPLMLPSALKNIAKASMGKEQLDVEHIARAVAGTIGVFAMWQHMKSKGIEFYSAAKDSNEIRARKAKGQYSGTYIKRKDGTMKRTDDLAPISYYYAAFAAIDDAMRAVKDGKKPSSAYWDAARAFAQNMLSGSVYGTARETGIAINDALTGSETGSRDVYPGKAEGEKLDRTSGERWLQRKAVGVSVPRLGTEAKSKGWGQAKDTTLRTPRDLREEYAQALGFGKQDAIPSQLDVFGKEMKQPKEMGPWATMTGPGVPGPTDPAMKLLDALRWYPSDVPKTVDGVRVSSEKRRALLKAAGPEVHAEVLALANDPGFRRMPRNEQREELKKAVSAVFSSHLADLRDTMYDQIQKMSEAEKNDLRYNMRDKDAGILEKWGLE